MTRKQLRRWVGCVMLALGIIAAALFGKEAYFWGRAWLFDHPVTDAIAAGYTDDASRLNNTPIAEVWAIPADPAQAEMQLRELLVRASHEKLNVSIAGARHSMGGHTICPDGILLDMLPFDRMQLDETAGILYVGAGARWSKVIPFLNAQGMSVAIMQSNSDFSVGGSISVNCHGWQQNRPPIASSVESFRLMKSDGEIVDCSRRRHAELFSLALGGYGLFGVILEVDLRVVPNERYQPEISVISADNYVSQFAKRTSDRDDVGLAYGRLCVVPGEKTFLREAIFTSFRKCPCETAELPPLTPIGQETLRREVYRAQIGSEAGKAIRWNTEKTFSLRYADQSFSRNQLLNEVAEVYRERNADRTDILHEYFVPADHFNAFLEQARAIIPRHPVDLLNVTVRNVLQDRDTLLRYADRDVFSLVMLFNQQRTQAADRQMQSLTRELIDAALQCGGRYYLPYRLHASTAQFNRAYPMAAEFFRLKRQYDPQEVFQNEFYRTYDGR